MASFEETIRSSWNYDHQIFSKDIANFYASRLLDPEFKAEENGIFYDIMGGQKLGLNKISTALGMFLVDSQRKTSIEQVSKFLSRFFAQIYL